MSSCGTCQGGGQLSIRPVIGTNAKGQPIYGPEKVITCPSCNGTGQR